MISTYIPVWKFSILKISCRFEEMFILFLCELFSFHWIHINSIKKYFLKVFKPLFILVNVCVSTFKKRLSERERERGGGGWLAPIIKPIIFFFSVDFLFFGYLFRSQNILSMHQLLFRYKKKHINTICLINYSFISLHKCIAICFRKHESFRALDWTS